jgi:RNA polymerase sigma factor (sigma-70 family)
MSNDEIFAAAYREHYWAVSRYVARRLQGRAGEVEEVVAEVFTVAWRRRGDLPDAPLPWLYGVARNCLANAVRGYGRRRRLVDRLGHDEAAHARHIVASPDDEAPGAWVHEALDRLSPADREVLRLAAWEELDAEQIAVTLGCGRRAAAMRLHRARRRLRAEIDRIRPSAPSPAWSAPSLARPTAACAHSGDQPDEPLPGHRTPAGLPADASHPERRTPPAPAAPTGRPERRTPPGPTAPTVPVGVPLRKDPRHA